MNDLDSGAALASDRKWEASALPGISLSLLRESNGERTLLLRIEPGAKFPLHRHPAGEQVYVVSGCVEIGGKALAADDYLFAPAGSEHAVSSAKGCVLFITVPRPIEIVSAA